MEPIYNIVNQSIKKTHRIINLKTKMFTTNKKFFDKKNILKNQDANMKFTQQKNEHCKNSLSQQNTFKDKDSVFSMPYEPEDQYTELAERFTTAKLDVGYQSFQKAFPFKPKQMNFTCSQQELHNNFSFRYDFNNMKAQSSLFEIETVYQDKQEFITYFQEESSEEQDESLDEEQSTKEHSNHLKQDND